MDNKKTINTKKTQKSGTKLFYTIGSIVILVLAALAFVLIPALTTTGSRDEIIVGSWNKKPIKYVANSDFTKNVEYYSNYYKQQGYEVNDQNFYTILDHAFTATVLNRAIIDEVDKAGYIPSQNTINRELLPYFYDTEGNYSAKIFRDTPDSKKIEYKKNIIENLKYGSYVMDHFAQTKVPYYGLKSAKNESVALAKMNAYKKGFDYVAFSTDDYPLSQARNFANENPDLFTEYNFSVISFDTEAQAKSVRKQLEQNEITFFDAVENFSTKNYSGDDGIFTYTYQYQIKPLLASEEELKSVLATEVDSLSPIVKTSNTYSIFKANKNPKQADFTTDASLDIVLNYLKQYEMGRVQDYFISLANDFSLNASLGNFAGAAEKFNREVKSLEPFALNYGNSELLYAVPSSSDGLLYGAERNESFLKTAFSLEEGEVSAPIILGSNVLVLQCTEEQNELSESELENYTYIYAYYAGQYNENSFYNYFLSSDKTVNNVFATYLKYFYQ